MLIYLHGQELNGLTNREYCIIIASLKYLYSEQYQCNSPDRYKKNGAYLPDERIKLIRKVNGCFNKVLGRKTRYQSMSFSRCPCNFYDDNIKTLIDFNEFYNVHKRLPNGFNNYMYGTEILSVKMKQALVVINNFIEEAKAAALKKAQQEMKDQVKNGR